MPRKIKEIITRCLRIYRKLFLAAKRIAGDVLRVFGLRDNGVAKPSQYNMYLASGRLLKDTVAQIESSNGISIITLNLNGAKFIKSYLEGIKSLNQLNVQLVFVDHGSTDNSVAIVKSELASWEGRLEIIQKEVNDSFSQSNNDALAKVEYDNVLLLNNDVVIPADSELKKALSLLENNADIGAVGWQLYHDIGGRSSQHEGISFVWDNTSLFYRPINIKGFRAPNAEGTVRRFPAVTAALVLLRKSDLISIDGLDTSFNYGYEDVDLCLRLKRDLGKLSVVVDGVSAVHLENKSQNRENRLSVRNRRLANQKHFNAEHGFPLRLLNRRRMLEVDNLLNLKRVKVGFVVTEAFDKATAGDYFTALEFAGALKEKGVLDVCFFPQRGPNAQPQVDCSDIDILVVMIDRFDVGRVINRCSNTILVAWMRNWFDRWISWPYFSSYDLYFCSSQIAADYILFETGVNASLLEIGTNYERFASKVDGVSRSLDICFVGSRWGVPREVEQIFPILNEYNSAVFGHGWRDSALIGDLDRGPIKYDQVAEVYSKAKIVIDDAASSTKKWGSVNSRVYDALAAGCMVISNAAATGDIPIPTYSSSEELKSLLDRYLGNEALRVSECSKLQSLVMEKHSYAVRAKQFKKSLNSSLERAYRIAIKVPAPNEGEKHKWGDYHFAESLKSALKALGHFVRIDLLESWYSRESELDDVVIVLRGLSNYEPKPHQINLMWNISHPDKVSDSEYQAYDTVFVASISYAHELSQRLLGVTVLPLLQCTDPSRFYWQPKEHGALSSELLFVGNSRRVFRDVVKYSVESELPLSLYGGLWESFVPAEVISGQNIDNSNLRRYYRNADVVLNDHWETMRKNGFISNRLFDVVASGGVVVTDCVSGMGEIFGDNVITFDGTKESFLAAVDDARQVRPTEEQSIAITQNHSFANRAESIIAEANRLSMLRLTGWS
ncbi:MAG: glycosyltransferase [Acidiferrobacterales bacterium]|nr:glycosyltransferase [Acidiferrobacterales bacterium]